jgi:hypothetical protein
VQRAEIPIDLFRNAVSIAKNYDTEPLVNCEDHPAVKILCDWWNLQAAPELACAGSFSIFVRDDDSILQYIWLPNYQPFPLSFLDADTRSQASVGVNIIVEFYRYSKLFDWNDDKTVYTIILVGGDSTGKSVRDEAGAEAWAALEDLQHFSAEESSGQGQFYFGDKS